MLLQDESFCRLVVFYRLRCRFFFVFLSPYQMAKSTLPRFFSGIVSCFFFSFYFLEFRSIGTRLYYVFLSFVYTYLFVALFLLLLFLFRCVVASLITYLSLVGWLENCLFVRSSFFLSFLIKRSKFLITFRQNRFIFEL